MDNKITKKRINEHLEYDWYKYLLIFVAVIVVTVFACNQINRSRDYEDFTIFAACYSYGEDDFENIVLTEMNGSGYDSEKYGEPFLREISLEKVLCNNEDFSKLYQTHGMVSSDALVLGESYAVANAAGFLSLTDEVLGLILPDGKSADDFEYLEKEVDGKQVRCGINVSSFTKLPFSVKNSVTSESDEKKNDEKFYLVINPRGANIGSFGWRADEKNLQAFFCIKLFLQYYY